MVRIILFSKGNFSIFVLVVLATAGLWSVWREVLFFSWEVLHVFGLLRPPPGGSTTTLDILVILLLSAVVLAGWVFFVARLGKTLFFGPTARQFGVATIAFLVLLSLWLIWSLYSFLDIARLPAQRLTNQTEISQVSSFA